ncbi:hypothetical protein [Nocardiopsis gilva]|uniref:hypothetical protein n=1 Tax=Nocardiopsis gilva TaxID=280236 RepID=UPI00034B2506|nr:hypothetical protein [Nocardiopsis gilva]
MLTLRCFPYVFLPVTAALERATLRQEVRDVLRAAGMTALLVTLDREEAMSIADLVALMRGGRVAQTAPPREVYERPADAELAAYMGRPSSCRASSAMGGCGAPWDG